MIQRLWPTNAPKAAACLEFAAGLGDDGKSGMIIKPGTLENYRGHAFMSFDKGEVLFMITQSGRGRCR